MPGAAVLEPAPFDRSNRPGRRRGACSGDPGSFLTIILGVDPLREALGGEDLRAGARFEEGVAVTAGGPGAIGADDDAVWGPRGLPLPTRWA